MPLRFRFKATTLVPLVLDSNEITSGEEEGAIVGTLGNVVSVSRLSLPDDAGGRFALDGETIVAGAVATDIGVTDTHNITVRETNPSCLGSPNDTILAITVVPEPQPPLGDIDLLLNSISSGAPAGTVVGALSGMTSGSTLTLHDDAGDRFALDGNIVIAGSVPTDFATNETHNITVRETLLGSPNSPNDTVLLIDVTEATAEGTVEIAWATNVGDPTPGFDINWLETNPSAGWTLRFYVKGSEDEEFTLWHSHVLSADDITTGPIDMTGADVLVDDDYVMYATLYTGSSETLPSNSVVVVIDVDGDESAPAVTALYPVDGEIQALVASSSVMTFNESVQPGASASFRLTRTGVGLVEELDETDFGTKIIISGTQVTLNWSSDMLNSTAYNIQWDAGSVEDAAQNPCAASSGATDWNFLTIATGSADATYIGRTTNTSSLTTYTFNNVSIGTAVANRRIVVGITNRCFNTPPGTMTSVTLNGNAMSLVEELATSSSPGSYAGLYEIVEASGTTCTIVVTWGQSQNSFCSLDVFTITNSGGVATDTFESIASPGSGTLSVPINGCAIGLAMCGCSASTGSWSWTNLTEDADGIPTSGNCSSAAHSNTAEDDTVITATASGTTLARRVVIAAAWAP